MTEYFRQKGAILIGEGPADVEFGIDLMVYNVAKSFRGFIGVPFGLHLLYFGSANSSRCGLFVRVESSRPIIILSWNPDLGQFVQEDLMSSSEADLQHTIVNSLHEKLINFPENQFQTWLNLTASVNDRTLQLCGLQIIQPFYAGNCAEDNPDLNHFAFPKFTSVEILEQQHLEKSFPTLNATDITAMKLDKSWLLRLSDLKHILGEFQLSFILFLTLFSFPALEYWKSSFALVASSSSYLQSDLKFAKAFLLTVYHQTNFISVDLIQNEISEESFVRPVFNDLLTSFKHINDSEIAEIYRRLTAYLAKRFEFLSTSVDSSDDIILIQGSSEIHPNTIESLEDIEFSQIPSENFLQKELQYSWRYPNLYTEVIKSKGREDYLMTSLRVLDEVEDNETLKIEALSFIKNESKFF